MYSILFQLQAFDTEHGLVCENAHIPLFQTLVIMYLQILSILWKCSIVQSSDLLIVILD